jgi:hypothetical protein
MAAALNIRVCAVVHDAILIEAPVDQIEAEAARARLCLERASRMFLNNLTLRVDKPKYIKPGERFTDRRGAKIWGYVESVLNELRQGAERAA